MKDSDYRAAARDQADRAEAAGVAIRLDQRPEIQRPANGSGAYVQAWIWVPAEKGRR